MPAAVSNESGKCVGWLAGVTAPLETGADLSRGSARLSLLSEQTGLLALLGEPVSTIDESYLW